MTSERVRPLGCRAMVVVVAAVVARGAKYTQARRAVSYDSLVRGWRQRSSNGGPGHVFSRSKQMRGCASLLASRPIALSLATANQKKKENTKRKKSAWPPRPARDRQRPAFTSRRGHHTAVAAPHKWSRHQPVNGEPDDREPRVYPDASEAPTMTLSSPWPSGQPLPGIGCPGTHMEKGGKGDGKTRGYHRHAHSADWTPVMKSLSIGRRWGLKRPVRPHKPSYAPTPPLREPTISLRLSLPVIGRPSDTAHPACTDPLPSRRTHPPAAA